MSYKDGFVAFETTALIAARAPNEAGTAHEGMLYAAKRAPNLEAKKPVTGAATAATAGIKIIAAATAAARADTTATPAKRFEVNLWPLLLAAAGAFLDAASAYTPTVSDDTCDVIFLQINIMEFCEFSMNLASIFVNKMKI